jgi:signal transduction histidine kinase
LIFANIGSLFAGFFTVSFLDMRVKLPKLFYLMRLVFRGYAILFVLGLFDYVLISLFGSLILAMIAITLGIIGAIRLFDKKNYAIIFYLIGWAVLGISISIYIPLSLGSVEPGTEPNHIFYIGILLDSLLMTLAIFFRVTAMRREKDEANANMLKTLKEKQQLVFEQNQLLEQSVSIRTEELQFALEREQDREEKVRLYTKKLEISNQELMDFAHIVSHDLRAPLRNISTFTDLLRRRNLAKFDERDNEFMNFIIRNSKQAIQLVEDLLIFARIDKDLGSPKPIDLNRLIEGLELNLSTSEKRKTRFIIEDNLPTVKAHIEILTTLFKNLITNSIKFNTSEYPTIEIGMSKIDKKDTFWIRDNGIGIPAQYHQEVFMMFSRLHTNDKYEGSGIGLPTCRKVVSVYGGDIWLKSEEGKGTTFFFTLPKAELRTEKIAADFNTQDAL